MLFLLSYLHLAYSATEYLAQGISLKYYFNPTNQLHFEFWFPSPLLLLSDWASFEFFPVTIPRNRLSGDSYIIFFESSTLNDYFLSQDGVLNKDTDLKGESNIFEFKKTVKEPFTVFSFSRPLNTEDALDTKFKKNRPYVIRWTLGKLIGDEMVKQEGETGIEYFVLSEDYIDKNDDETGTYGPWVSQAQYPLSPPFNWTPENYMWSFMVENSFIGKPFDPDGFYVTDDAGSPANFNLPEL